MLSSLVSLPVATLNIVDWHSHEMLFGFVGGAIGGFVFTAVSNWTGREPVHGIELGTLCLCWLAGRLVMALGGGLPPALVMALDLSYFILLILLLGRELYLGGNRRNYVLLLVISLLLSFNAVFHLETMGVINYQQLGIRGATMLIVLLISIIGGRIIPAFTGNWLAMKGMPAPGQFNMIDKVTIVLTVLVIPVWMFLPASVYAATIFVVAACAHTIRLARWRGLATISEPLLFVLHIGYAWIPLGFLALGAAIFLDQLPAGGLHALTVGAMATMIMAVSSRAAMGHTGRQLTSSAMLTSAFVLINLAAITRVTNAYVGPDWLLMTSALAWFAAFFCFAISIVPVLVQPSKVVA